MHSSHWLTSPAEAEHEKVSLWICAGCGLQIHRVFNRVAGPEQFWTVDAVPQLLTWRPGDPCPRAKEASAHRLRHMHEDDAVVEAAQDAAWEMWGSDDWTPQEAIRVILRAAIEATLKGGSR